MLEANIALRIDEEKAIAKARSYLDRVGPTSGDPRFIAGISGGIDSALLASLVVHLYGPDSLRGFYLYDRDSAPRIARAAAMHSEQLGIELVRVSIEPHMRSRGIYRSIHMRLTDHWGAVNRGLYWLYHFLAGESPFMTSLRVGGGHLPHDERRYKLYRAMCAVPEKAFNARHIYRRQFLEQESSLCGAALLGAANRSEWSLGWFVKGGIDDVPYQPLIGLYKTQVRQLAEWLGLSELVIAQAPSPDMRKGITDEFAIGATYENIDLILDYLEGGVRLKDLHRRGIGNARISRVSEMRQYSSWKRGGESRAIPIDGGPAGGLRIDLRVEEDRA